MFLFFLTKAGNLPCSETIAAVKERIIEEHIDKFDMGYWINFS